MAAKLGNLLVDIGASTARLEKDLSKARGDLSKWGNKATRMMKGVALSMGAALSVRALVNMGKETLGTADKIAKLSRSVGVSVEELSAYSHAAELSGTSIEAMARSIGIVSKNMLDMRNGTGEAKDAFEALGLDVTTSNGGLKSANDIIKEVAERFKGMRDGTEKTALAMRIFGRSGAELIPMLNNGAQGIADMQAEAEKLGLTFDTKTAYAAERINDQFTRIQGTMTGAKREIITGMLPTLENLSNVVFEAASNTAQMEGASKALATGLKLVVSSGLIAHAVFASLGDVIGATAAATVIAIEGDFKSAFEALKLGASDVAANIKNAVGTIKQVWDETGSSFEPVKTEIVKSLDDVGNKLTVVAKTARSASEDIQDSWRLVEDKWETHSRGLDILIDRENQLSEAGRAAGESLGGGFEAAIISGTKLRDIITNIAQDLAGILVRKSITAPLAGAIGGMFPVASAKGNVFSGPGISAHSNSVVSSPTVFPFARGVGLMGEAGPEAIMPLKRGAGGKLGVEASGGGVHVEVHNYGQSQVKTEGQGTGANPLKIIIDAVDSSMRGGQLRNTLGALGMSPSLMSR